MQIKKLGEHIYAVEIGDVSFVVFKHQLDFLTENLNKKPEEFSLYSISNKRIDFTKRESSYKVYDNYTRKEGVLKV